MQKQVEKYLAKLQRHGLVDGQEGVFLYGLDDEVYTNAPTVRQEVHDLFGLLNINSLIIARPEPVLWNIISSLADREQGLICPCDCESLTFIHDIPVVPTLDASLVAGALNRRKGCIVRDTGLVTTGNVTLEQAFIIFSSICFASFVKFFADALNGLHGCGCTPKPDSRTVAAISEFLGKAAPLTSGKALSPDVPTQENRILHAMDEAGKAVVEAKLVDSFFGNISYRLDSDIYISQTGSSLDELAGCIDRVPMDGSSTCGITSSSELMAHVKTYELTRDNAILHGHPRFSVIMSMFGEPLAFGQKRYIEDIPVISGEVGAGKHGLLHTLPTAMQEIHGAVVSGHGTFASCLGSFTEAYDRLSSIEHRCYRAYRDALQG